MGFEYDAKTKKWTNKALGVTLDQSTQAADEAAYQDSLTPSKELYDKELALEDQIREAMKGQVAAEQQGFQDIASGEKAAQFELRRSAAKAMAQNRGLSSGGRGIAVGTDIAKQAGAQAATINADFAGRLADARSKAAAAQTERLAQEGKLLEAGKARQAEVADAQNEINKVVATYQGKVYTSDDDYARMAADLEAKALAATNPSVKQKYKAAADQARNKSIKTSSLL